MLNKRIAEKASLKSISLSETLTTTSSKVMAWRHAETKQTELLISKVHGSRLPANFLATFMLVNLHANGSNNSQHFWL